MSANVAIIIVSALAAAIGLGLELSSSSRVRKNSKGKGGMPSFVHKNLHLIGGFRYKNAKVYYHSLCFGPFLIAPLGCYLSDSSSVSGIRQSVSCNAVELLALYLRWAWVVLLVSVLVAVV